MLGLGSGRAWFGNRFSVSPLRLPVYVLRGFAPRFALEKIRQRPILPGRLQPSTFGAERLNFCVRVFGMRTGGSLSPSSPEFVEYVSDTFTTA